ncbi:hypothetical protein [Streptomyces sp. NPDC002540]
MVRRRIPAAGPQAAERQEQPPAGPVKDWDLPGLPADLQGDSSARDAASRDGGPYARVTDRRQALREAACTRSRPRCEEAGASGRRHVTTQHWRASDALEPL